MGDPRMRKGDPLSKLSAPEWNRHCDVALAFYRQQKLGGVLPKPSTQELRDSCKVKVKNLTEADLPAGSVVQLGGFLLTTDYRFDDRYMWLEGNKPADPGAAERYAILLRPIPSNEIGEAFVSGCCIARINVNDTAHKYATPVDDSTDLESAASGPIEIISEVGSTGSQLCYVKLGQATSASHLAKVSTVLTRRASGVCNSASATIWEINSSDTLASTGETKTIYNPNALPIITNDLVLITQLGNGKWIATELMSAMRDFWYHAKLGTTTLGNGNAIGTSTLNGGTSWATTTVFPVSYNSGTGTTLINMPGYYRLHAVLYIESKWTQPDDNTHHWARIQFQPYLGGSVHAAALGYANFVFPAKRTSSDNNHNHSGEVSTELAHHHTHTEIGGVYVPVVLDGIVTKTGTSSQAIDIRPTAITTSTSGPAIADFGCPTGSIDLKPVGYGDPLGAWPS